MRGMRRMANDGSVYNVRQGVSGVVQCACGQPSAAGSLPLRADFGDSYPP